MPHRQPSYLLLFRDAAPQAYRDLSAEQRQQLLERWNDWFGTLAERGQVEDGRPLEPTGRVISLKETSIVDGPFAEAKEAVGGYFVLTVDSLEEATAIGRQCPGLPFGITVEVRPVASQCPVLRQIEEAVVSAPSRERESRCDAP